MELSRRKPKAVFTEKADDILCAESGIVIFVVGKQVKKYEKLFYNQQSTMESPEHTYKSEDDLPKVAKELAPYTIKPAAPATAKLSFVKSINNKETGHAKQLRLYMAGLFLLRLKLFT